MYDTYETTLYANDTLCANKILNRIKIMYEMSNLYNLYEILFLNVSLKYHSRF